MRILMVSLDFPPVVGGISAHVYELSKTMVQQGHEVIVLTRARKGLPDREECDGIEVRRVVLRLAAPFYGLFINAAIHRLVREKHPDLVHVHGMAPLEWLQPLSAPLVYTNHTSGYLARIQKGGIRRMFFLRRYLSKPNLILAPSQELLQIPFRIPAHLRYIPNGVDVKRYRFSGKDRILIREKYGFSEKDRVGILTRRFVEKNGVIFFAKACEFLKKETSLRFILIGDGPEAASVRNLLEKHVEGRFIMTGSLMHPEILPYYSAADFSVLPSLMEATSISGLEAMSYGLPLVGTRVGGIPDLIEDRKTGLLCEPASAESLADAIVQLLTLDMKTMGYRGRKRVEEEFAWDRIAEKTLDAYKEI